MTIREKIIHKQLSQYFVPDQPELFTCCLLTTNSSVSGSTHLYSQTFLRYIEPTYQMLPMRIVNLSDSNNSYKSIEPTSETFNTLVKSLRIDQKKTQGINVITQINEELQKRTEDVATQLAEAEKRYFELQEEVLELQEKLKLKQMSNDVNMIEVDKNDRVEIVENGSGDDVVNSDSIESFSEVTKGGRGRKKSTRTVTTRNSSRSPVKVEVNVDNIISNRTRNRTLTPSTGQKK